MKKRNAPEFYESVVKNIYPFIKLYHRLEVFGLENLPPEGQSFVIAPNHSGWFGWDALVISSILGGREIRWVAWSFDETHPDWDRMVRAFNAILHNNKHEFPYEEICETVLKTGKIVGIFPEGNSNPLGRRYRLRPFFPGCIRLAAMADVPIVPTAVSGLEEASPIILAQEHEKEPLTEILALPVVFPTKVKIQFGVPMRPKIQKDRLDDKDALNAEARVIQLEVLRLLRQFRPKAYAEDKKPVQKF